MGGATAEPIWYSAKLCDAGACVEIGTLGELVMIRNSVDRNGACISLSRDEWQVFVAGVKAGNFDGL